MAGGSLHWELFGHTMSIPLKGDYHYSMLLMTATIASQPWCRLQNLIILLDTAQKLARQR